MNSDAEGDAATPDVDLYDDGEDENEQMKLINGKHKSVIRAGFALVLVLLLVSLGMKGER